eukprot:scaffold101483_cov24-Tisochrysis_lutea.AAC.1
MADCGLTQSVKASSEMPCNCGACADHPAMLAPRVDMLARRALSHSRARENSAKAAASSGERDFRHASSSTCPRMVAGPYCGCLRPHHYLYGNLFCVWRGLRWHRKLGGVLVAFKRWSRPRRADVVGWW